MRRSQRRRGLHRELAVRRVARGAGLGLVAAASALTSAAAPRLTRTVPIGASHSPVSVCGRGQADRAPRGRRRADRLERLRGLRVLAAVGLCAGRRRVAVVVRGVVAVAGGGPGVVAVAVRPVLVPPRRAPRDQPSAAGTSCCWVGASHPARAGSSAHGSSVGSTSGSSSRSGSRAAGAKRSGSARARARARARRRSARAPRRHRPRTGAARTHAGRGRPGRPTRARSDRPRSARRRRLVGQRRAPRARRAGARARAARPRARRRCAARRSRPPNERAHQRSASPAWRASQSSSSTAAARESSLVRASPRARRDRRREALVVDLDRHGDRARPGDRRTRAPRASGRCRRRSGRAAGPTTTRSTPRSRTSSVDPREAACGWRAARSGRSAWRACRSGR